jgi:hypothetical protein
MVRLVLNHAALQDAGGTRLGGRQELGNTIYCNFLDHVLMCLYLLRFHV